MSIAIYTAARMSLLFIGFLTPEQVAEHGHVGSIERLVPTGVDLACTTEVPDLG